MKLSFDTSDTPEEIVRAASGEGSLTYRQRPFESECFENRTFEVLDWDTRDFAALFNAFLSTVQLATGDLVYLRLPADAIAAIKAAEEAGFYFIESSIVPFIKLRNWDRAKYRRFISPMQPACPSTIDEVEEIARATFRGLRFNLDPNIGDERADRRYLRWLRNAYEAGEDIQVLKHHERIAGFSLLRFDSNDTAIYRLAGMRPDLKNAGLGMMLYASTMASCQDRGVKHIDGGISMANTPVLNVMAGLGFLFRDPTIVFHYYVR